MSYQLNKDKIIDILKANEKISHIKDVDSLLDHVLYEARTITNADAGSIYLKKGEKLSFEYVQNDTLTQKDSSSNKYLYAKREIPIDNESIAGYAALNRTGVLIDDVYRPARNVPYTFNRTFDESSSYHTRSVLTVPLMTTGDKLIGVMQIINAKDEKGCISAFSQYDKHLVTLFANHAASAIERAQMTREIILRMIKIAEMRDPEETGPHVNRVGAICIEIYQRWAARNNVDGAEIKKVKDLLRISAMLHDVGKVAISDAILRKKTRLSKQEREIMKFHTVYGARLFNKNNSDWDDMAAEIALNHHEKWDGTGYPGYIGDIHNDTISIGPGKKGRQIPLPARIVALADVYDALMSNRSYKEPWPEEKVIDYISAEKNKHFDPELVNNFMEIYDVIKAIREKYSY